MPRTAPADPVFSSGLTGYVEPPVMEEQERTADEEDGTSKDKKSRAIKNLIIHMDVEDGCDRANVF